MCEAGNLRRPFLGAQVHCLLACLVALGSGTRFDASCIFCVWSSTVVSSRFCGDAPFCIPVIPKIRSTFAECNFSLWSDWWLWNQYPLLEPRAPNLHCTEDLHRVSSTLVSSVVLLLYHDCKYSVSIHVQLDGESDKSHH